MVDWEPVRGTIPPLTEEAWEEEFSAYRSSPEYRLRNRGLDLDGFRRIFWVEYAHRLLARTVGVTFVVPLVVFGIRRRLPRADLLPLAALFVVGAGQGLLGWLMVRSGLVDRPHVSAYRLAAHLVLGASLFAGLLWLALDHWRGIRAPLVRVRSPGGASWLFGGCLAFLFVSGAFMAGTGAGHAYRTFPLIAGELLPPGLGRLEPWWRNPFENLVAVHLFHRGAALLALIAGVGLGWRGRRLRGRILPGSRFGVLVGTLILQVGLGATTLVLGAPPALAGVHQAGAFAVLAAWVVLHHGLASSPPGGVAKPDSASITVHVEG